MKIQNHYEFPEFDHRAAPSRQREQHRRSWSPSAPPELVLGGAASRKLGNFQTPFLGRITPPSTLNRQGKKFVSFLPAISAKAAKEIRQTVRTWRIASTRNNQRLEDLAKLIDPVVRGWMNYYGRYYRTKCVAVLHHINAALARWARRKYKRFRYRKTASVHWLGRLARRDPNLLYLWQIGIRPSAGR